jgi:hypothetical protein
MGLPNGVPDIGNIPANSEFAKSADMSQMGGGMKGEGGVPPLGFTVEAKDQFASVAPLAGHKSTVQPEGGMGSYKTQGV